MKVKSYKKSMIIDIINKHYEAIGRSSQRSRWTILILITGSILAFISFWNSRQSSWLNNRIRLSETALYWFEFNDSSKTSYELEEESLLDEIKAMINKSSTQKLDELLPLGVNLKIPSGIKAVNKRRPEILKIARKEKELILMSAQYVSERDFNSSVLLKEDYEFLKKTKHENVVFVKLPFFGLSFDINDLGMFTGISFVIILLLLRFSLDRELTNIKNVIGLVNEYEEKTKKNIWKYYNSLMAAQLVYSIPKTRGIGTNFEVMNNRRLWNFLPKLLLLIPWSTYSFVIYHDVITINRGVSINGSTTKLVFTVSLILYLFMMILIYSCYKIWIKIDKASSTEEEKEIYEKASSVLGDKNVTGAYFINNKSIEMGKKYKFANLKSKLPLVTKIALWDGKLDNLEFLRGFQNLKHLHINAHMFDFNTLKQLKHLEKIIIHGVKETNSNLKFPSNTNIKYAIDRFKKYKTPCALGFLIKKLDKELLDCKIIYKIVVTKFSEESI